MKNKIQKNSGITLISLILTIIILLILAGITINLTIGENGLFKVAKESKDIQKIAEYKERIEISRVGTAADNLGEVTMDNLIERIYKDKIVEEGSIRKIEETKLQVITKEGYVLIVTLDGVEYIDKKENITSPDLQEGVIMFSLDTNDWTNESVKVSIQKNTQEDLKLMYSLDNITYKEYTKEIEFNKNGTIYACLENFIGERGSYASTKITKIDKLDPKEFIPEVTATTNTITISANIASDTEKTTEYGKSGIKEIWYSIDEGLTWQTNVDKTTKEYKYINLTQKTEYKIRVKVIDNANNEMITKTIYKTTGTVTVASGNVTIGTPTWDASTHKASVTITKANTVSSNLSIQYQVGSTTGEWKTGTSVIGLSLNQTVHARLWDGTNGGSYTSLKITEKTEPTITVDITAMSTNSITASARSVDNQSGMPTNPTYTFCIKKTSEADTAYVQKQSSTTSTCTFTGLTQNTSYTVKVTAKDNAGNTGVGTKEGTTKSEYTISYNANGGSGAPANQTKTQGTDIKLSTIIPTRDGYGFIGWATSASATTGIYQAGDNYTKEESVTLYAVWQKYVSVYKMSTPGFYNLNVTTDAGRMSFSGVKAYLKVNGEGYNFKVTTADDIGRYINILQYDKNGTKISEDTVSQNTTRTISTLKETAEVYCSGIGATIDITLKNGDICKIIKEATYKINFITNGGTINSGNVTNYTSGQTSKITLPTDVTKSGYIFDGWYNNSSFTGNAITTLSSMNGISGDLTYYAKWLPVMTNGTKTYNSNGYFGYDIDVSSCSKIRLVGTVTRSENSNYSGNVSVAGFDYNSSTGNTNMVNSNLGTLWKFSSSSGTTGNFDIELDVSQCNRIGFFTNGSTTVTIEIKYAIAKIE